jgi:hypothetical protein
MFSCWLRVSASLLLSAAAITQAATVGDPLIARPVHDSGIGQVFAYAGFFLAPGDRVISWAFFSDPTSTNCCNPLGTSITPLIVTKTSATTWRITGIGTTRKNLQTGVQNFPFGLVSGSDIVGENSTFAWKDGGISTHESGIVHFGSPKTGVGYFYLGQGVTPVVGNNYTSQFGATPMDRDYSIQFTTLACGAGPAVTNLTPNRGGNSGLVTTSMVACGVLPGATARLVGVGTDIVASTTTFPDEHFFTATFDLRGAASGTRALILTNRDGTSVSLPNAFTVEQGGGARYPNQHRWP